MLNIIVFLNKNNAADQRVYQLLKEQIEDRMKGARNNSFETEDQILLCSVTDEGTELDIEQCKRLFSLPATISPLSGGDSGVGSHVKNLINQIAQRQQAEILQMNSERNAGFFDTEMEKLDRWAEDVKSSMEIELKGYMTVR